MERVSGKDGELRRQPAFVAAVDGEHHAGAGAGSESAGSLRLSCAHRGEERSRLRQSGVGSGRDAQLYRHAGRLVRVVRTLSRPGSTRIANAGTDVSEL